LINNAGIMVLPKRTLNADGAELQMATNYYGHFLLTSLLLSSMKPHRDTRIVTVSSTMAVSASLDFANLQSERRYKPWRGAYAQSKLANLVFAVELSRRLKAAGADIASIAAHPGSVLTNLGNAAGFALRLMMKLTESRRQPAQSGALPILFAATSPEALDGRYYGPDGPKEATGNPTEIPVPASARDQAMAERLWTESCQMTGQNFDLNRATFNI
jgi:NAD(P)-dependent dehydrogenase (short-subunit alcohol dehydrogenase family)